MVNLVAVSQSVIETNMQTVLQTETEKKKKRKETKQKSDIVMYDRFALNATEEDYHFWPPNNRWWSLKTTANVKASCTVSEWY